MNNSLIELYVVAINVVSAVLFAYDKKAARNNRRRIPERTLHLFEMIGGVFANLFLMYALHHKNRKFSYWVWTWLIMIGWVVLIFVFEIYK
jgi:uncharacterized membrane protein YsdA (DUF1294 family)